MAKPVPSEVIVRVIRARDLLIADEKTSDPFAKITIGRKTERTKTIKKTLSPEWNEEFKFSGDFKESDNIAIELIDEDMLSNDDLGNLVIPLANFKQTRGVAPEEKWYDVDPTSAKGKATGAVQIAVSVNAPWVTEPVRASSKTVSSSTPAKSTPSSSPLSTSAPESKSNESKPSPTPVSAPSTPTPSLSKPKSDNKAPKKAPKPYCPQYLFAAFVGLAAIVLVRQGKLSFK